MSEVVTFEDMKMTRQFINAVEDLGFTKPTLVQKKCFGPIKNGQEVIGIAPTGTGKTAAFTLPLLHVVKYAQGDHPRIMILVPTKELVLQSLEKVTELIKYTDLRVVAIYGGIGPKAQIEQIRQGVDILVATPGRFMEIYMKGDIVTKHIKHLVLDEADRMMDMGFMPQLRNIFEVIPNKRQNLLFSATFSDRVEYLSQEFLEHPLRIEVAPQSSPAETIKHYKVFSPNFLSKLNLLEHYLKMPEFSRVMVFAKTRKNATEIARFVDIRGLGKVRLVHANKGQNNRINAFNEFKEGEADVLVSTDVTARGIDITDVSHVINFDVPLIYEDYVHRIGRTGRAERTGEAVTFFHDAERWHIRKIEKIIGGAIKEEKWPKEVDVAEFQKYEEKDQLREIDMQKKKDNPDFKGAFHEKKKKFPNTEKKNQRYSKNEAKSKRWKRR